MSEHSSSTSSIKKGIVHDAISNPLLESDDYSDQVSHMSIREKSSFDLKRENTRMSKRQKAKTIFSEYCHWISDSFSMYCNELKKVNFSLQLLKCKILLIRSYYVLVKREKMVIATCCLNIFLAVLFGIIIGPSSEDYVAITALFGIGTMLLLLSNVQFLFWIFQNNEVLCLFN